MSDFYKNKIAFVTGAGSGIGLALSRELILNGCIVYLADINSEALKNEVDKIGINANAIQLDVTNRNAFVMVVEKIIKEHNQIDFLFNNAGIGYAGDTLGYSFEDWDELIDVNLKGVINGTAIIYPLMKKQGSGHIIFTASLAGLVPSAMLVPYATSKHAIIGLSRSLRLEAEAYNVNVSAICPGTIDTPMLDNSKPTSMDEEFSIDTREYLTLISGKPMSSSKFATEVLKGVEKNQEFIFYPKKAKEIWRFSRFMPKTLNKLAKKALKKFRTK